MTHPYAYANTSSQMNSADHPNKLKSSTCIILDKYNKDNKYFKLKANHIIYWTSNVKGKIGYHIFTLFTQPFKNKIVIFR